MRPVLSSRILATGRALPRRRVETEGLLPPETPRAEVEALVARTGIRARRWLAEGDSPAALAADALAQALARADLQPAALRRLILVTSSGGDLQIPACANLVADALGLAGECDAFDLNNGCTGFLTALDLASRCAATGLGPVGVVALEALSRCVRPEERRPYLVLADAAAAAIVDAGAPDQGVVASVLGNDPRGWRDITMPRGEGACIRFAPRYAELVRSGEAQFVGSIREALARAELALEDIDWLVPHQPNGPMLRLLLDALGPIRARVAPPLCDEFGSLGAASLALGLDALWSEGPPTAGAHVLLAAIGAGYSYGALILRA